MVCDVAVVVPKTLCCSKTITATCELAPKVQQAVMAESTGFLLKRLDFMFLYGTYYMIDLQFSFFFSSLSLVKLR